VVLVILLMFALFGAMLGLGDYRSGKSR